MKPMAMPRLSGIKTLTRLARTGKDHRTWYHDARGQIEAAAVVLEIPPDRLIDLLALFSPRVSVLRSIRFAVHYVRTGGFMPDCTRSVRATVRHYAQTGIIRGPKSAAFARALRGDGSAIVLDTWIGTAFGVDGKRFEARYFRRECERRIAATAKGLGWSNAETQAAIWAGAVRANRLTVPAFLIMSEVGDSVPF